MILHLRNTRANNSLWFPHKIHKENFASPFFFKLRLHKCIIMHAAKLCQLCWSIRGANWNYLCSMYRNFTLHTYIVKVFAKTPNPMWSFKSKTSLHQQSLSILLVVLAFSKSKTELSLSLPLSLTQDKTIFRENNMRWCIPTT